MEPPEGLIYVARCTDGPKVNAKAKEVAPVSGRAVEKGAGLTCKSRCNIQGRPPGYMRNGP